MQTHIRRVCAAVLVVVWLTLTAFAWLGKTKEVSDTERRPLAQFPTFSAQTLLDSSFMKDFEQGTLDQFPLRDSFRKLKALFHYKVLNQKDNNGIYLQQGHAAKILYPLNEKAVELAARKLQSVYEAYLQDTGSRVFFAVIPDKGQYLAQQNGYPAADYGQMVQTMQEKLPMAIYVDLYSSLRIDDYYKTDIHWRQENLLPVAVTLADALGVTPPNKQDFTPVVLDRPFYGVYHGQAALPMEAETMVVMESELLKDCTVYDYETGKTSVVYDMGKLDSKDLYDVFLSGSKSLLTIENPYGKTDRELIVFRDSFASSLVPLLLQDYAKVTLVDIRYMSSQILGNFLDFTGQDVLFLYSTTVLNTEGILK